MKTDETYLSVNRTVAKKRIPIQLKPIKVNNDHTIVTLEKYLKQSDQPLSFLFRGVTRSSAHTLIPSVARDWKEG